MLLSVRLLVAASLLAVLPCQRPASSAGVDVVTADAAAWQSHRATKVLYAGWPAGSREAAFRAFLERHFDKVGVIDLAKLSPETAQDFDVVIADWCSQYGNDGYTKKEGSLTSAPVKIGDAFGKPIIAMDYVSTNLRGRHKLDWL
jgi:hypothetical protein